MTTNLPEPGPNGPGDHAAISRRFLEHAEIEIDKGNRLQASEKVWGAVSHALKSVAEKRGWEHGHRQNILDISAHLGKEFDLEGDFDLLLGSAKTMHVNFYENEYGEDTIRRAIGFAGEFVDQIERVRDAPPRPFTIDTTEDRRRLRRLLNVPGSEVEKRLPLGSSDMHGYSQNADDSPGPGVDPAARPPAPGDPSPRGSTWRQLSQDDLPTETSSRASGQGRNKSRPPTLSRPKPALPAGRSRDEKPRPRTPSFFRPPRLPGKK